MNDFVFEITIPAEAVPFARAGSHGKRRFTPVKQANFMGVVRMYADRAMEGRPPFEGAIGMRALFLYAKPMSWSAKKKAAILWKTSKPDVSNLVKICEDALNGCVYLDDAQIAFSTVQKRYADAPSLTITIYPLDHKFFLDPEAS